MKQSFVKISKITEPPYSDIWVYPKGTKAQIKSRIKELQGLCVEGISFQGELQVGTLNILGKGYVGVVVLGKIGRKKVAVKIRRNDSPRKNLKKEAELLGITNQSNVGPKLVNFSKNFLVMEYLEGKIQSLQKRKHNDVKLFLRDILKNNLKNSGIPKGLEKDFKKGIKIIDANKVSTKSIKEAIANVAVTDETILR